ncbi:MAG: SDR family oxidoreductase [Undibacterium sp.]|nr:SDR family oxidoreductase [Undibacterium sp.]
MQAKEFTGQTILITGASSGIGLATAQALIQQGARRVYITGRNQKKLEDAQTQLGDTAIAVVADVSQIEQINQLKAKIAANQDQLDLIFANAGIAENNTLGTSTEQDFSNTFDSNVKGVFFTVQNLLPLLKDGGNIILNASVAANKGMPNLSLYSASKAAVRSFARSWCNDLKHRKIRVNTISPGPTLTPILEHGLKMSSQQISEFDQYLQTVAPAGRLGEAKEIANAVLFLASSSASYINGIELCVDGGFTQI